MTFRSLYLSQIAVLTSAQCEIIQADIETEGQESMAMHTAQPQMESMISQNGQWFPNPAQMYAINYGGGWGDYNQMMPNGWMGGYGSNMMGKQSPDLFVLCAIS